MMLQNDLLQMQNVLLTSRTIPGHYRLSAVIKRSIHWYVPTSLDELLVTAEVAKWEKNFYAFEASNYMYVLRLLGLKPKKMLEHCTSHVALDYLTGREEGEGHSRKEGRRPILKI